MSPVHPRSSGAVIRVGTRASALALAQAGDIADRLAEISGSPVELVSITSRGDVDPSSLSRIGGTGVFAGALREALLAGQCDVVVHSLKDLPTVPHEGLVIAGVPERADARDALCAGAGATLDGLRPGARVGTGSPRRAAQLRRRRPDLEIVDLRGNVDTRLARVRSGDLDAVVLSVAGLERLGRTDEISESFELDEWPTAPGQGALAIEVRTEDAAHLLENETEATVVGAAVRALTDPRSEAVVTAERAVLRGLEAGCTAPIGVFARFVDDSELVVHAVVYAADGGRSIEATRAGTVLVTDSVQVRAEASAVSEGVVSELLAAGAADLAPLGVSA